MMLKRAIPGLSVAARRHWQVALRWERVHDSLHGAIGASVALLALFAVLGAIGAPQWGYAAAFGCLAVAGTAEAGIEAQLQALLPVALAIAAGAVLARMGLAADVVLVLLAFGLALIGSRSRDLARDTTRALLFLVMSVSLFAGTQHRLFALALIALGASVTSTVTWLLMLLFPAAAAPAPARANRRMPWSRLLRQAPAWRYAARVGVGLCLALTIAIVLPTRHLAWIAITTLLLTQRAGAKREGRHLQRALGTLLGVGVTALLPHAETASTLIGVALLAGARVWLQPRHYLLYSAVMAILVLTIISQGQPPSAALLADRVIATLIGIAIAAALARLFADPADSNTGRPQRPA